MRLLIQAASPAIARSLAEIATSAGIPLATEDETTDSVLHHTGDQIIWHRGGTVLHTITCPVRPEALARILASQPSPPQPLDSGWRFDATARQLVREGEVHALTEKESLLLAALLTAMPESCTRDGLLSSVWGMQADVETHTLETHIYRLRAKLSALNPKPCDIITVDGAYQLQLGSVA